MKVTIETIPHEQQRYPTVGDWCYSNDRELLSIRVSAMGDWRKEVLVAIHEFVEACTCRVANVSQREVDRFDIAYEGTRGVGDLSEPGDSPQAPYHQQHCFATGIERMLCSQLGISWAEYETIINSL